MRTIRNAKEPEVLALTDLLREVNPDENLSQETVSVIEKSLAICWVKFKGSHLERTTPEKLLGRTENMSWCPPILTFAIERHGRTVNGSTRADLHTWQVNFENMTASIVRNSFRQLESIQLRLDIKPLVEDIIETVAINADSAGITWDEGRTVVKVIISHYIPDNCCSQTLAGRRKRFRSYLEDRMKNIGWSSVPGRFYVYTRT